MAEQRTVRLLRPPGPEGPGIFAISARKQTTYYAFGEIGCDIGGRAFALHRLGLGMLYHVRIGPEACSCECLGFLAHDQCKHVLALSALLHRGLV